MCPHTTVRRREIFTFSNLSPLDLVSISPPINPVYVSRVDPSDIDFSLSLHRPTLIYKYSL
jgi:hypothetical protein